MKYLRIFLFGIFAASIVYSAPIVFLTVGIILLIQKFSYAVILIGFVYDMIFNHTAGGYPLFYTSMFAVVAMVSFYIKKRIFWY